MLDRLTRARLAALIAPPPAAPAASTAPSAPAPQNTQLAALQQEYAQIDQAIKASQPYLRLCYLRGQIDLLAQQTKNASS